MDPATAQAVKAIIEKAASEDSSSWVFQLAIIVYAIVMLVDKLWYHGDRWRKKRNGNGGDAMDIRPLSGALENVAKLQESSIRLQEESIRIQTETRPIISEIHRDVGIMKAVQSVKD